MKFGKKLLSLLLALTMVLGMVCVPAAATEEPETFDLSLEVYDKANGGNVITEASADANLFVYVNYSGNPAELADSLCGYAILLQYDTRLTPNGKTNKDTTPSTYTDAFAEGVALAQWASTDGVTEEDPDTGDMIVKTAGTLYVARFKVPADFEGTIDLTSAFSIIEKSGDITTKLLDQGNNPMPATGISYTLDALVQAESVTSIEVNGTTGGEVQLTAKSVAGAEINGSVEWTVDYSAVTDATASDVTVVNGLVTAAPKAKAGNYTIKATPKDGVLSNSPEEDGSYSYDLAVTRAPSVPVSWRVEQTYSTTDKTDQEEPYTYHVIPALKNGTAAPAQFSLYHYVTDQYGEERSNREADDVEWAFDGEAPAGVTLGSVGTPSLGLKFTTVKYDSSVQDVTFTLTGTLEDSGLPTQQVTVTLKRLPSEIATVTVTGDTDIDIPETGTATTNAFTAVVKDQYDANMNGETVTWSVAPENQGVTIGADGKVTVSANATAGGYTVTATAANGESGDITLNVKALPSQTLTFASETVEKTYGDAAFTNALTGAVGAVTYESSDETVATVAADGTVTIVGAGTATITATAARVSGQYSATTKSYGLTVAQKEVTVVSGIAAADKVYDGNTTATLVCTGASIVGKVGEDDLSVTATGAFANKNAGENKTVNISGLTLGGADADNYKLAESGQQATTTASITPKELTINDFAFTGDLKKTYNGSPAASNVIVSVKDESLVNGDSLGVGYTAFYDSANVKEAGKITVTINEVTKGATSDPDPNYTVAADTEKVFTKADGVAILPKEVTVTVDDITGEMVYQGSAYEPVVTVKVSDTTLTKDTDYAVTYDNNINAGENTAKAIVKPADEGNYTFATVTKTFTINPKAVTITVNDATKTFGQDDPTFTGTVSGLVAEGDLGTVTYGRESGENVGTYDITATYTENTNYDVTVVPGTLTITKAAAPADVALTLNVYYGMTGSKSYTVSNFDNRPTLGFTGAAFTGTPSAVTGEAASAIVSNANGSFALDNAAAESLVGKSASWAVTIASDNYEDITATVTVNVINKTPITVSLDDAEIDYGETYVPAPTGGNDGGVWSYLYTGTTNAGVDYSRDEAPTEAGEYTVTVSYEDEVPNGDAPGYVGQTTANLVINKKSVGAVWSNYSLTYNGEEQKPTATATGINGALTLTVSGGQTNAGSYTATAALSEADAANYVLTNETTEYSIAKVVLTPAVDTVDSKVYDGDTDATGTVKLTGAVNGETPVAEAAFAWTSANAGTATVNVTVALTDAAVNKNYELSTTTLSGVSAAGAAITKKPVTVEWTVGSYTYNGSEQTLPTASFTGVDGTVSCTVTVDGGKQFKNAGEYGFTATEASGNYELSNATTTATVAKAARTLSFAEDTFRILPGKTVTVAPSFNALDGSGSVTYGTSALLTNSGNSFTAAGNGTVTITAKVAETANYEASNTVNLTFHAIKEFNVTVGSELTYTGDDDLVKYATTKVVGLHDAVAGVVENAKAIALAKADKVDLSYGAYDVEVFFYVNFEVVADNTAADPKAMTLSIEPSYMVFAYDSVNGRGKALQEVTVSELTKAIDVYVTLENFTPNAMKQGGSVWQPLTMNGNVATWKQDSLSNVELLEDKREATINFVKDNGTTESVTYDIFDLGAAFPEDSKSNHRFNDWTLEGVSGTHTELTEALWNEIAGETVNATPNFSKNVKPNATRYEVELETSGGGKASLDRDSVVAGTTVTVTAEPNEGYKVASVKVENEKTGESVYVKANGSEYSFTMPEAGATVTVTFAKIGDYPFTDVPEDKYYYDAVLWAVDNGVTTGKTATTFDPNGACTRAQVVTFLWRAAGCPAPTSYDNPFTDVAEGKYYYEAVLWAVENGITSGKTATTFDPNGACTRAQVVTFLWRTAGEPKTDRWNSFEDVAFGKYYHDAVVWAVVEGVTGGKSTTVFDPNGICTRGQIVTFLYRYFA